MQYRLEKLGIHVLAFFVARCQMLGMYPFVVPFFMANYIEEQSSFSLYLVVLLGVLSRGAYVACLKYALVIGVLILILSRTDKKLFFTDNFQIALAAGVVLGSVSLPYEYIVTRQDVSIYYSLLEGIIGTCGVLVLQQGLVAFKAGTSRRFATNERFIGVFSLIILFLFGIPGVEQPVHVLFIVSAYLLLYYCYRFDGSAGMATGSVVGLVLAFQTKEIAWLAVMILMAGLIVLLRELGKVGIMLGFFAGYLLLGFLYQGALLEKNIMISALVVLFLFLITPEKLLHRIVPEKEKRTNFPKDIFIQQITRNRLRDFGHAFIDMEKILSMHEEDSRVEIPDDLSNIYLSGDGISLLNAVESQSNRLLEMRHNFVKQLGQIGETIAGFSGELIENCVPSEVFENKLFEQLSQYGVRVIKAMLVLDKDKRVEAYVNCTMEQDGQMTGEKMASMVSRILARDMVCVKCGEENPEKRETIFWFVQKGTYMLTTGIVRKNRQGESLCGDNFSITKIDTRKAVMMISDGMGYGEMASMKSERVVELLEQLLTAGFRRELAIWLLNSFFSLLSGGNISSTLDLTMIDLYDGTADFIKLGASTTFIKRKQQVECIHSTSLPVGLMEQVEFDTCSRKLYHGDMVIMISDGVMDGVIFENKETYLADFIASYDTNNVQLMAQGILQDVERMNDGMLRDDSTVLAVALWER